MTILNILKYPNPELKQISTPVTDFDSQLDHFIQDLEQTRQHGPAAVGIAAPQVGCFQRIIIIDVSSRKNTHNHGHLILINPEITEWDGYVIGREGCLSVPDYTGNVIRAETIKLQALDPNGQTLEFTMQGFEARALQHELDHLDGLLFIDRLVSRRTDLFQRQPKKSKKSKTSK